jgi:hypothetical protein
MNQDMLFTHPHQMEKVYRKGDIFILIRTILGSSNKELFSNIVRNIL